MEQTFFEQLNREMDTLNISLTEEQCNEFLLYYKILLEWNQVMNLTAITEQSDVITKHFTDSVSLVRVIPDLGARDLSVADLGTGAGFPGIPLKIVFPNLRITLMDSLDKRVRFLNHVIEELELKDIHAIHGRAEELGQNKDHREQYDLCVSRAVANMAVLCEYCLPLVKTGGVFTAYKTESAANEVAAAKGALKKLGGSVSDIHEFSLPNGDPRTMVVVKKVQKTPPAYPRKAGTPRKSPIL